jgi:hypothetical protein
VLANLWCSYSSRTELVGGQPTAVAKPFRRGWFNRVGLNVGEPMAASKVSLERLRERVAGLLAQG